MNWRATSRRLLPYAVVAAGGFLLAYLVVAFLIFPPQLVPDDAKVPQVVGLLYDEAVTRLEAAGFKARTGEERFVELAPKSTVLAQSPPPGASEPRGAEIVLDVSAGRRQLQVPSVIGLTQALAQDAIEKAGLEVGDVSERESQSARGAVLEISPAVGTAVSPSTRVDMVVSSGPPAVEAPDVVGQSYSSARSMLEQVGLRLGDVLTDSLSASAPQSVISQTPAAGTRLAPGTRVSLTIAP
ncbi:MAG TPA: PASTA domain-containing protein [Gemmatimonadaceae bacterium]|nr:PASTA domain-containing protein [Gemmatimonadaceae bacterium]